MTRATPRSLVLETCACLAFLFAVVAADTEVCDESKCSGPLRYYKDLGCKPVYKNPGDCCAVEYDCSHVEARLKDKCYVNGKEYAIGEPLKPEDANACDIGCVCHQGYNGVATFVCAEVDCAWNLQSPGCYSKNSPSQCCPGPSVCLEQGEVRPTCEVDGKIYHDGEYFKPISNPELTCYCMEGYKGENIEPFCKAPNRPSCSADFRHAGDVYNHCAPVYYENQDPQTDCSISSRCQDVNDTVLHDDDHSKSLDLSPEDVSISNDPKSNENVYDKRVCKFGTMTMHVGDELNQSDCVKCKCEVPPLPTCRRISYEACTRTTT